MARTKKPKGETCEWSYSNDDYDFWVSACGVVWQFNDSGPRDNGMVFCHGCGRKLKEVREKAGHDQ